VSLGLKELESDRAAADREERFVDVVAALVAILSRRYWCSQPIERSTTRSFVPSPELWPDFGQAIFAWMGRLSSSRRLWREW
jgi:hypothetical protein